MGAIAQRLKSNTYRVALVPVAVRPYMPLIFPLAMMVMREFTTTALADK